MPEVALAMGDDNEDIEDVENPDEVCYLCDGDEWVYDGENGTMCCPECEEES